MVFNFLTLVDGGGWVDGNRQVFADIINGQPHIKIQHYLQEHTVLKLRNFIFSRSNVY